MSIWFKHYKLEDLEKTSINTMVEHLGIKFTEIGADFLIATMPVDQRTKQPAGLLHGGASVVLAETLGSVASFMVIDPQAGQAVGLEINANHLKSMREGEVIGRVSAIHLGKRTHVWEIRITNPKGELVCISRLTVAILVTA